MCAECMMLTYRTGVLTLFRLEELNVYQTVNENMRKSYDLGQEMRKSPDQPMVRAHVLKPCLKPV